MRKNMFLIVGAVAAAGCGAASHKAAATPVAGLQCGNIANLQQEVAAVYAPEHVVRVEPLERTEFIARAIQPRYVAGAKLYVPAQRGVTEGYLERVLSCHAAGASDSHPNDPLLANNVRDVDVESRGQTFLIHVEGADRRSGAEIWKRARTLRDASNRVEVRQLSSASTPSKL